MALQLGALRDALLSANVPSDKADKASEEVAAYESRLANVESRLNLLTWMMGVEIALTVGVFLKLFH